MDTEALEQLVERVVQRTAPLAIGEAMIRFGIDTADPIKIQRNMAFLEAHRELVESDEYKKDMEHVRSWRNTWDAIKSNSLIGAVSIVIASVGAYLGLRGG